MSFNKIGYLLTEKRFLPFFMTQFWGSFNDNAFKMAMLTLISYHVSTSLHQSEQYQAIAGGLYMFPFFIFSATAGQLADRFDKASLTVCIKLLEVFLAIVGGFALYTHSFFLMMFTLTGFGIHSTFFGPIKYAILPMHLKQTELLGGTSLIEASTFMAILLGTIVGTLIIGPKNLNPNYAILLVNLVAWFGLISSIFIPKAPAHYMFSIDWNIWRATIQMIKQAMHNRKVLPALFNISWFWFIGAVILIKLPDYTHYILRAEPIVFAFLLSLFSIGIALGSIAIGYILGGNITLRYVAPCMFLLSFFSFDLYLASPNQLSMHPLISLNEFLASLNNIRISIDFFLLSFFAGLFIVPVYTYIQIASEEKVRARTIATNNIFNSLFMILGSGLVIVLLYLHISIPVVFLILAILNIIAAAGLQWAFIALKI